MATDNTIAGLIPHAGSMCLLERVIEWTPERVMLATTTHRALDNPLRSGGRLRAIHLCEYGAQAMAVHGGLVAGAAGETGQPGLLVALRDVRLLVEYIDDLPGELVVEADRLHATPVSWQYRFRVLHAGKELVSGRAAVMLRPGPARAPNGIGTGQDSPNGAP
jgi:predicted hotdog family 3-hydroxylacyl-ACP dehydratase